MNCELSRFTGDAASCDREATARVAVTDPGAQDPRETFALCHADATAAIQQGTKRRGAAGEIVSVLPL